MKFGIRQECGLDNYEERLDKVRGVPIELALPYKLDEFLQQAGAGLLDRLTAFIKSNGNIVQSVHASQGHITDGQFTKWGLDTVRFAESVGASVVVFHPEDSRRDKRLDTQISAIQNIKRLQRETSSAVVAVESFGGSKRVLFPEEIVEKGLNLVLDTSHLFEERTLAIIEKSCKSIVAVHLSEARDGNQHMPVTDFGYKVMEALQAKNWSGVVTLEYLPDYHPQMAVDREMLETKYGGGINYGVIEDRAV